ncbi:MAG: hypothetical protein A2Z04_00595 [Chloroflexi bacterium RBG_16_57_9]|nr:MAG: hypothetical protein A2Z04_00595 [Chloroflexi bacterium RBG_16_57_9]
MIAEKQTYVDLPIPEDGHPWPPQGEWTYDDYLRLPDDGRRYEIIEGVLYVTNAPDLDHQSAVGELFAELRSYVRKNNLGIVIPAPLEVHLPGIAKPVQPDVLFVTTERRPPAGAKFFEGAPDLIVEVLSQSTLRLDRRTKFDAYERAGVREYWIVDTRSHFVEVYVLSRGEYALHGQFGPGEQLTSQVLAGLSIPVDRIFG